MMWNTGDGKNTTESCQLKTGKTKTLITAGVDVGSVGSKAAIMIDGEVYSWGVMRTGSNSPDSAKKVLRLGHGRNWT